MVFTIESCTSVALVVLAEPIGAVDASTQIKYPYVLWVWFPLLDDAALKLLNGLIYASSVGTLIVMIGRRGLLGVGWEHRALNQLETWCRHVVGVRWEVSGSLLGSEKSIESSSRPLVPSWMV